MPTFSVCLLIKSLKEKKLFKLYLASSYCNHLRLLCTDKPTKATRDPASSGARKGSSSSIEGEDDFLAVVAPEMPEDVVGQPDGFVTKIKRWCSWLYYYIAISVDKVIELLNDISKDYREIADQLKRERKEKRIEKLRRAKFGYAASRFRLGEASDPEADNKVRVSFDWDFHCRVI